MAKEVWVKWTDSVKPTRVIVEDPAGRPADVDDLRRQFVIDRNWTGTIDSASLQVFDKEGDGRTELDPGTSLKGYAFDPSEGATNDGPGQSWLTTLFIILAFPQPAIATAVQNLPHMNRAESVFVLYEQSDKGPDPIATAFAVSDSLLLTAAHNIVDRKKVDPKLDVEKVDEANEKEEQQQDEVVANLMIATALHKSSDGIITAENGRAVTLEGYHFHHDWAFLRVCEGKLLSSIPVATERGDLPPRATLEKMYIYHCAARIFRDSTRPETLHAMMKEVNVGAVGEKFLSFQNGGFKGSCGGPYIFRNKAVALHVESSNDSVDYEMLDEQDEQEKQAGIRARKRNKIDKVIEVAESSASSHLRVGTGLILMARSGLMKVYQGGQGPPNAASAPHANLKDDAAYN